MALVCHEEDGTAPLPPSWRDFGIRSRLSFALEEDGDDSKKDVTFLVGEPHQIITAHRLILSLSSLYFDHLIREEGYGLIKLPAVDPAMFKRLLKFIYTDEIESENIVAFLEFAKSFGFHHLEQLCLERWQKEGITVENVACILALEGRQKSVPELREKCIQFICRNADRVTRLETFKEISQQDLACILESDDFVLPPSEAALCDLNTETVGCIEEGDIIWICPTCMKQDDGSPMIGCELCDDWYHFICVGILVTPDEDTDWFCPRCTIRRKKKRPLSQSEIQAHSPPQPISPESCSPVSSASFATEPSRNDPRLGDVSPVSSNSLDELSGNVPLSGNLSQLSLVSSASFDVGLSGSVSLLGAVSPVSSDSFDVRLSGNTPLPGDVSHVSSAPPATHRRISAPTTYSGHPPPAGSATNSSISTMMKPLSEDLGSSSLTELLLSGFILSWNQLIIATKRKHLTLTRIVLNNLTLLDFDRDHGKRVVLPQLKAFLYSLDRVSGSLQSSLNPSLPDKTHPYFVNTKSFLFFEKTHHARNFWVFPQLPNLQVDIRIYVNGIKLLTISPSERKILLSYPPPKVGDLILQSLPFNTKSLSLCCTVVSYPNQIQTGKLERINFYNVEMRGMTPIRFVNQCSNLKHVSLHEYQKESPRENPQLLLSTDFKFSRSSLESLALTQYNISCPPRKSVPDSVPFSSLESLYLNHCGWNYYFPRYFHRIFPMLKRFGIRYEWKDKSEVSTLLAYVLDGCKALEYLSISRRTNESSAGNVDDGKISNLPTIEEIWIHNFLSGTNPTAPDIIRRHLPSGNVKEDLLAQNIVLRRICGVWVRDRNDDGGLSSQTTDQIYFKALKLDDFFEDAELAKFLSL